MDLQLEINKYLKNRNKNKLSDKNDYDFSFIYSDDGVFYVDIIKNKKHLVRATYEVIGCYDVTSSYWTWAWAINQIEHNLVNKTKFNKIQKKILESEITKEIEEYLYYLNNRSFFISYKNLDKLLNFALYVSKGKNILAHKIDPNKPIIIEFIIIKDIVQEH